MVRQPRFDCNGMKKGAWSEEEDEKLRNYIMKYGHWNWRLLPKYAGLARCGKSCRFRWVNYLKPGIKRGNFSKQERDLVVKLHAKLGNKWSAIAAKLPGRSDNEIKNFWKTHIEKLRNRKSRPAKANTKGTSNEQEKPSQIISCKTTRNESMSLDSLLQLQDSSVSFDTESSDTVENPQVDFWTDHTILESDTVHSQINLLPPLQEEDFPKYKYNEFSGSESSYSSAFNWIADEDSWPGESFVSYNSNSKSENGCVSEDIQGFYEPCFEYFDYGMDLF